MKKVVMLFILALAFGNFACADVLELSNSAEFEKLIQQAEVPVIVKFSAYW